MRIVQTELPAPPVEYQWKRDRGVPVHPVPSHSEFVHQRVLSMDSFFSAIIDSTPGDPQLEQSYSFFRSYFYMPDSFKQQQFGF